MFIHTVMSFILEVCVMKKEKIEIDIVFGQELSRHFGSRHGKRPHRVLLGGGSRYLPLFIVRAQVIKICIKPFHVIIFDVMKSNSTHPVQSCLQSLFVLLNYVVQHFAVRAM